MFYTYEEREIRMGLVKFAIKMAVKIPKIESFNSFLFVGPHPDDIEIGAGATIAKLASQGKKITFLICTDGRFGDGASEGVTGDALAALRKEESIKSAAVLGVSDVRFLDLKDGGNYDFEELCKKIAEVVSDVKPDIVFAPDPMSRSESHEDHLNVGNAVKKVACFAPYEKLMLEKYGVCGAPVKALGLYMTIRVNSYVSVNGLLKKQFEAIFECHKSQYRDGMPEAESLKLYLKLRYLQYGRREGFKVYTQTHMHCLPEAE